MVRGVTTRRPSIAGLRGVVSVGAPNRPAIECFLAGAAAAGRMTLVGRAAVVGIAVALAGCSTAATRPPDISADLAAITAFNARYLKSINDGDIATLSSLTDDDHMMISPGRPPVAGK